MLFAQAQNGIFEVLLQAASQVPSLVVMVAIVWVFLKHIKESQDYQAERDNQYEARQESRDKHLETLGATCHAFQHSLAAENKQFNRELSGAMQESLKECRLVIHDNTVALTGMKNELSRHDR